MSNGDWIVQVFESRLHAWRGLAAFRDKADAELYGDGLAESKETRVVHRDSFYAELRCVATLRNTIVCYAVGNCAFNAEKRVQTPSMVPNC